MDIAGLSMGLAKSNLLSDVGTAMLSKSLDLSQSIGDGMVKMIDSASVSRSAMELSVNPNVGANFDFSC